MTPFPDDRQLDEYAELLEDEGGPNEWTEEMAAMAHDVAVFLRSPRLREALRTQEAVAWLNDAARREGVSVHIATADRGYTVRADECTGRGTTLHEAVTRLRASQPKETHND